MKMTVDLSIALIFQNIFLELIFLDIYFLSKVLFIWLMIFKGHRIISSIQCLGN